MNKRSYTHIHSQAWARAPRVQKKVYLYTSYNARNGPLDVEKFGGYRYWIWLYITRLRLSWKKNWKSRNFRPRRSLRIHTNTTMTIIIKRVTDGHPRRKYTRVYYIVIYRPTQYYYTRNWRTNGLKDIV